MNLLDIYPTLIALCGLPNKAGLEGNDLTPLLEEPGVSWEIPSLTTHRMGNHALRLEDWHYIRYADGSEELYDLASDPNEWTNLAGGTEYEEVLRQLATLLPQHDQAAIPVGH